MRELITHAVHAREDIERACATRRDACAATLARTKPLVERVCQRASLLCAFLIRPWLDGCTKLLS